MSIVAKEIIILHAEGDEKYKSFNFEKYPIYPFSNGGSISPRIILTRNNVSTMLVKDIDYLIDDEESSVLFLIDILEEDRVHIEDYMYEDLYYRYMYKTREILGDTDYTSFLFKNKNILLAINTAYNVNIKGETSWDIEYDPVLNRITTDLTEDQLYYIASFAALFSLKSELHRRLLTSIYIKDGVTTIDNTKTLDVLKKEIDDFVIRIQQELTDELIFGRYAEYPFANIDGIAVYTKTLAELSSSE